MIIQHLRLHPFAGITERAVPLQPGLNVIVGPNEAGKTTFVKALKSVLFIPTKLGKRQFDSDINPYLPLQGGDTIRVTLKFNCGDCDYELSKSWGKQPQAELRFPGGKLFTDPTEVQEQMGDLLALKQGTYERVLIAYQANLPDTLKALSGESEEANDLAELLRKTVFATDGVSIEQLGITIEGKRTKYYLRWDRDLSRPEDRRGIDNPWAKSKGLVLQAYYDKETLRQERKKAEDYEQHLDALNERINAISREKETLGKLVAGSATVVADAEKRAGLEVEAAVLGQKEADYRRISQDWPKLEERLKAQRETREQGQERLAQLANDLGDAKKFEAAGAKRDKLERARSKAGEIATARQELATLKPLSAETLGRLESLDGKLKRLVASLQAGRLRLKFTPHRSLAVEVRKDLAADVEQQVAAEVPLELEAGGRIVLRHEDWELDVQSGESAFEDVQADYDTTTHQFQMLLKETDVDGLEGARKRHSDFRDGTQSLDGLERHIREILGGDHLETLSREVAEATPATSLRTSADIAGEKGRLESEQASRDLEIENGVEQLGGWQRQFETQDKLLDKLLEARANLNAKKKAIETLKPLPEGVTDAGAFVAGFREKGARLKTIREDELPDLLIQRAKLEGETPDQTLQELDADLLSAEANFERLAKEAAALDKIACVFARLREQMDAGTLDPWIREMKKVVQPLTAGRYTEIRLEAAQAGRADDLHVPYVALSMGTRACIGLAVRLSMARHFLDGRDGFLLLDDPLVDLDPDRQATACAILQHFGSEKQVIILTCHPSHADILGGHRVELVKLG